MTKKRMIVQTGLFLVILGINLSLPGEVIITAVSEGNGIVAINYDATSEDEPVWRFALDITKEEGIIEGFSDVSAYYWLFPSTVVIEDGVVIDPGTPVVPGDEPGALGGLGTDGITIEMVSYYEPGVDDPPPSSGTLLKLQTIGAAEVCIALNELRDGVVMEDGTLAIVQPGCYRDFYPACWNNPCQPYGDGNGDGVITAWDVQCVIRAWRGEYDPCCDFNRDGVITAIDLQALVGGWSSGCP